MKITQELISSVKKKWELVQDCLNEKGRRLWCAAEALSYGHGGIKLLHQATEISRPTIIKGIKEVQGIEPLLTKGIRKNGAGRKTVAKHQPETTEALVKLIEPTTRRDPETPLK